MLTKYERARIIGARALQLSMGAPPLIEVSGPIEPLFVAKMEFEQKVVPLLVYRKYPNGKIEEVSVN